MRIVTDSARPICLLIFFSLAVSHPNSFGDVGSTDPIGSRSPTLDDLLSPVNYWEPVISPDGERVAGVQKSGDRLFVVISAVGDENPEHAGIEIGVGELQWMTWVSNERLMLMVSKELRFTFTDADGSTHSIVGDVSTRVFAMNHDGSEVAIMFDDTRKKDRKLALGELTHVLPNDPDHVLMPATKTFNHDLFKVNIHDGSSQLVSKGKRFTFHWIADDDGTPAFRFDTNYWRTVISVYASYKTKKGKIKWKRIRKLRRKDIGAKKKIEFDFNIIGPGPAENTYYVIARPDGYDTLGIHVYDRVLDEYVSEVKVHPEYDIIDGIIDDWERSFMGSIYLDDRLVLDFVDKTIRAHLRGVDKYFGQSANVFPVDISRDGTRWVLAVTGPTEPGTYYTYDIDQRHLLRIHAERDALDDKEFAAMQAIKYEARDGLALTGYLTRPVGSGATSKPPLIVMPHGGPESRDSLAFNKWVQLFAAYGYQVFQPNFRGSSGYGKTFADAGRKEWGRAMQYDIEDGFHHLVEMGLADADAACIVGSSYGGYAALAGAALTPDLYRCAVAMSGVSHLPDFLRWQMDKKDNDSRIEYWTEHMGSLSDDIERLRAASPAIQAGNINIPVLLIHGEQDAIVPIAQSEIMARELQSNENDQSVFVRLEKFGHGHGSDDSRHKMYEETMVFLTRHLPASRPFVRRTDNQVESDGEAELETHTQSDSDN